MVALVQTVAYLGLEARGVEVQCQIAPGLPRFNLVGLPDKAVSAADLALPPPTEGSAEVAARGAAARAVQVERLEGTGKISNAQLDGDLLEAHATPDEAGRKLLLQAAEAMRLSARGYTRMLRVARTIADLAGSEGIGRIHVAEALSYRRVVGRS